MTTATAKPRLTYLDNLRVFCVCLVVLHHFAIVYGAPGDWYYVEGKPESIFAQLPLILFSSTNQAFFMGLLFFVSTFFVTGSYNRKGPVTFLRERIIRLGIPTLAFYFLIGPFISYLAARLYTAESEFSSFPEWLANGWGRGFGPMWFVETLIFFTLAYVLIRTLSARPVEKRETPEPMPRAGTIVAFAVFLGLITSLVRTVSPVGLWLPHLQLQLAHFPQYLAMMVLGVVAWQRGWLQSLTIKQGMGWLAFVLLFVLIAFPVLFIGGGAPSGNLDPFMGGWHWQNLGYSVYEQVVGLSLMVGLLGLFQGLCNRRGRLLTTLSDSSYTVYIIHAIPVILIPWLARSWEFPLLAKFVILSVPTLALAFGMGWLIRKLPFASKVL